MTSRTLGLLALGAAMAVTAGAWRAEAAAGATNGAPMSAPLVFVDIAGPDLKGQADFYRAVFGWDIGPAGQFKLQTASPLSASLRVEDPKDGPVAERVLYIGVPDVTAALAAVTAYGGSIVFPRLEVPGVAVLGLFKDPAGNRMGLVEMDGDHARVPAPPGR